MYKIHAKRKVHIYSLLLLNMCIPSLIFAVPSQDSTEYLYDADSDFVTSTKKQDASKTTLKDSVKKFFSSKTMRYGIPAAFITAVGIYFALKDQSRTPETSSQEQPVQPILQTPPTSNSSSSSNSISSTSSSSLLSSQSSQTSETSKHSQSSDVLDDLGNPSKNLAENTGTFNEFFYKNGAPNKWDEKTQIKEIKGLAKGLCTAKTFSLKTPTFGISFISTAGRKGMTQEDAGVIVINMKNIKDRDLFAVLDGHGGNGASTYVAKHLAKNIKEQTIFETNFATAIKEGIAKTELDWFNDEDRRKEIPPWKKIDKSGTTAIICGIDDSFITLANLGDSRAIIGSKEGEVIFATKDHKPDNPEEEQRIKDAGGTVAGRRVEGRLAVSRALGDFEFKLLGYSEKELEFYNADLVSTQPDITSISKDDNIAFVLLACDGLWDVLKNEEVAKFVHEGLAQKLSPQEITQKLVETALEQNSGDNITVILVVFKDEPTTKQD